MSDALLAAASAACCTVPCSRAADASATMRRSLQVTAVQRACKCDLAIRTLEVEKRTLTEALSAAAAQAAAVQHAHLLAETRAEVAEGLRAAAQRRADNAEAECAHLRAALSAGERSARAEHRETRPPLNPLQRKSAVTSPRKTAVPTLALHTSVSPAVGDRTDRRQPRTPAEVPARSTQKDGAR